MRVLMIVQELNETSWLRGFIVGWVRALAAQADEVHVLALELGEAELPPNVFVYSMGKEKGYSRPRELLEFYRGIGRVIRHVDVIFSHMTPRYTWLAAPYAMLYRKPQLLWYTHKKVNWELRLALLAATWIATATAESFTLNSPKVHVMGHGIDTRLFSPPPQSVLAEPPLVLAVGRVTPIKYHHTLLEAAALLRDRHGDPPVRFMIVGQTTNAADEDYQAQLIQRRAELGLSAEKFSLAGALPVDQVIQLYHQAAVATNLTPTGSFDKAALEAMLCGAPLLTPNTAFDLGEYADLLRVQSHDDAADVAAKLARLLKLTSQERARIGADLRERTAAAHGLESLMKRLVKLMKDKVAST